MSAADSRDPPAPLDIGAARIARVYAQAIVEAADSKHCRDELLAELDSLVADVLPRVPRARAVLESPQVPAEQKVALLGRLAAGRMLPTTMHALQVLARHGRLGILAEVAAAARQVADELTGRAQAIFTTAVPLAVAEQGRLAEDVAAALGRPLAPTFIVDPGIIGGLVVRVGDTVYDQSIATGLARLGGNLHRRTVHEIQHRRDRLASA